MYQASNKWVRLLNAITEEGYETSPRGMLCRELICHTSTIDMRYPIVQVKERDIGYHFMAAEAWWILTGQNRVFTIKDYGNIERFSNDGHHFDGAYGPRVVDQFRYVTESLLRDNDTRQAVMSIWRSNPPHSLDIPCTLTLQWIIRDEKINCVANMRSSDAWLGWPYDVFNFTMITGYIMLLLLEKGFELSLGNLYMNVGSQHLYFKNQSAADSIIDSYNGPGRWVQGKFDPLHYGSPDIFINELEILKDHPQGALGI